MPREAIKQATCENCDDEEAEFTMIDKEFTYDEVSAIEYDVRCSCGETGEIIVDEGGTRASDGINYEDASWNRSGDEDNE